MLNSILSLVLWTVGLIHFVVIAAVILPLLLLFPARRVFIPARWLCRNQLRIMGCRLEVHGKDHIPSDRAVLFLGNHESLFDIFAVAAAAPRFAVGLEASHHFRMPLWGRLTAAWGNLPVPEGRMDEARRAFDQATAVFESGTDVYILPEGHRTRTGSLGDLKKGAFHMALGTGADILPFVLQGLYEFHNTHSWRLHPRKLRVIFGEVIPFDSYRDLSVDELRDRVRKALVELDA